ncbi:MAG: DUF1329 domain-containing protein [Pseudomonadota bacterium]
MKHTIPYTAKLLCLALAALAVPSHAAVSNEEAERLKTTLTPFGAEKAGNKDGTIPAWTGGLTKATRSVPRLPPNLFADEKPILSISAKNADQYADKLSEGQLYLLKNYAGYRIEVFPTHRTFAAPQAVYDATYKNALNGKLVNDNMTASNVKTGIAFPIPKRGEEVILNSQNNWRGLDFSFTADSYAISSSGQRSLTTANTVTVTVPYHYPSERKDPWDGSVYSASVVEITAPAFLAGEKVLTLSPMDAIKVGPRAWTYLTGQRRLRKTPNVQYDVPFPYTSGMTNFDDANGFLGALDRYDWKLLGKKELYIPYNTGGLHHVADLNKVIGPQYVNPDVLRHELHRVWVVEATLKSGARHTVPKRRFYVDEDSWWIVAQDQWDAKGQFWKTFSFATFPLPEVPVTHMITNIMYNVQSKGYGVLNLMNREPGGFHFKAAPAEDFTPQALERGGVR